MVFDTVEHINSVYTNSIINNNDDDTDDTDDIDYNTDNTVYNITHTNFTLMVPYMIILLI